MKTLLISIIFLITLSVHSQTFQKTYGGIYSDIGLSVQQTSDGGYILFGQTNSFGNGFQDMYLVKTDDNGNELWYKTYGGPDVEFGISAQQTTDSGYILCGSYSGLGNDSLALIKTDQNGNVIWNKRFSGSIGRDVGQFVQQTSDGGFIAVGFTGTGLTEDIYIVKTDLNGNEEWSRVYATTGREFVVGVRETNDGGYVMIGETNRTGFGGKDMYLIKTDSWGDTVWTKTFGTSADEIGRSIYLTSDNGFILLGYEDTTGGNLFLVKTDSLGNEQWNNYYGGIGTDMGHSVQQTTDGGYILAGQKANGAGGSTDMYCLKTDQAGTIVWDYTFPKGLSSDATTVQQTTDGGFILLGSTTDTIGGINSDMYLVKIDGLGLISVYEYDLNSLKLFAYPNPFTEFTTITYTDPKNREFSLNLFDSQGKVIRTINNITSGQIKIERDNLASGLYFFQMLSDKQLISAGKLMIK